MPSKLIRDAGLFQDLRSLSDRSSKGDLDAKVVDRNDLLQGD